MNFWYFFVSGLSRLIAKVWLRYKVEGVPLEDLPQDGPLIIAPTHASYLEPTLVASVFLPRTLDFFASSHLFKRFFPGRFLYWLRTHPLVRGDARQALKNALLLLKEGKTIVLFPEGTRSKNGRLGELKKGVALLSEKAHCPVVPIVMSGTFEAWPPHKKWPCLVPKKPIVFRIGKPLPPCESNEHGYDEWMQKLKSAYIELGA